jgi:hypothetical protein
MEMSFRFIRAGAPLGHHAFSETLTLAWREKRVKTGKAGVGWKFQHAAALAQHVGISNLAAVRRSGLPGFYFHLSMLVFPGTSTPVLMLRHYSRTSKAHQ